MENKEILKIPYVVHEAAMFRKERIIKRLTAALVLSEIVMTTIFCFILSKKGGKR